MSMEFTYETSITYQGEEYYAEVFIDVTNVIVVPPDPMCRDSDVDFRGYEEMEFNVVGVELYNDDGECLGFIDNQEQIEELLLDYDKIEAYLWNVLEEMRDNIEDYAA